VLFRSLKKGDGAFLFVPQTLDGGWHRDGYAIAAQDISTLVFGIPWAAPNAPDSVYQFTNQTEYSGSRYFFSQPFKSPNATVRVDFIGYPSASNVSFEQTLFIQLAKPNENDLFTELGGTVVPTNITGRSVRMNAQLREQKVASPEMSLIITDVNGSQVQEFPQGNVNLQADKSFDVLVYADRGEYIVNLMDDAGKIYVQTYMNVVSIDINETMQDKSAYTFAITLNGNPFQLNEVSVTVDGGKYGTYNFSNTDTVKVDVGGFTGGESMPIGNHTFSFTAGGLKVDIPIEHFRVQTIFDNPMFWVAMLLTVGIVGVGFVFARQEEVFFSIDIPDFPPVARTKIPLSPDVVLSIFEKVNETYRWQNTPLAVTEIKNGFKDIFYKGKSIYITDYNVEYLLEELEKSGRVKEALGYYGLAGWEERTKRTMDYLALMRRLRDICVNNAVPFTTLGESPEADSVITVVGQQMFVHFYEKRGDMRVLLGRTLSTINKGITIILFKNPYERDYFHTMISSSPSAAPLIAKMEADSGSLQFLTADEFEKMLLEFKSV
jgi:hypothetical protein